MTGKNKRLSVLPLAKGLHWPQPSEPLTDDFARLAVNKGAPAILARYLREHNGGDRLIVFISNMIDPSSNSPIQLVPKYRRGKGRPSKSGIRKAIESAIDEIRVAEKMRGDPIGTRGPTKRAIEEVKEETKRSVRTIKRHLALKKN